LSVELPSFVELKIVYTEPGIRGDTATNTTKPAKLETGAEIQVPLFLNQDQVIKIDTRTSSYSERVK
jgi:elongation factor P